MALIKWNEGLSVHVAEMDRQHQKLVDLINELNDAMSKGKGKEVVGKTINGLLNYTRVHFAEEERLFDQFNYPDANSQKNMHKKFVDKVVDFKQQHDSGKVALSIVVIDFLSDWLKQHIQIEDKKYGQFFSQQGMK
jgi:hemerythrin